MSDAKGDLGRDFLVAKAKHLRDQLAAATARAEKAERELHNERNVTAQQADRIDVLAADCVKAERERDEKHDSFVRGARVAHELTHETQTAEEYAVDLVRQVKQARTERDELRAENEGLRAQLALSGPTRCVVHENGAWCETVASICARHAPHPARIRDEALREAVRELERQAQGWRNARTSSEHTEETADGYDAAAAVVQALLGKAGTT